MKKYFAIIGLVLVMAVAMLVACNIIQIEDDRNEFTSEEIAMNYYVSEYGDGDYEIEIYNEEQDWINFFVYEDGEIVSVMGIDKSYAANRNS